MKKACLIFVVVAFAFSAGVAQAGFSLNDLKKDIDQSGKCKKDDKDCIAKEKLKAAGRVAAIGLAAKLITDMIVHYKSKEVSNEKQVAEEYKKEHKTLPKEPIVAEYLAKSDPDKVVKSGSKVTVHSDIVVVPGSEKQEALIEEQLAIYDNENHDDMIKSLKKEVNAKTKRGGHFQNDFSFTLPQEMPQGIYPVSTTLWLNGKQANQQKKELQLVLYVDPQGLVEIVAMAR
jgi:hypothetical protein